MKESFGGCTWDTSDLFQCKQAFTVLRLKGFSFDELSELDFGGLDISSVEEEL